MRSGRRQGPGLVPSMKLSLGGRGANRGVLRPATAPATPLRPVTPLPPVTLSSPVRMAEDPWDCPASTPSPPRGNAGQEEEAA